MAWISAKELLVAVQAIGSFSGARGTILKRASKGLLEAQASALVVGKRTWRDSGVPPEFWDSGRVLEQDWSVGDFATTMTIKSRDIEVSAFGVRFSRKDAEAMGAKFGSLPSEPEPATASPEAAPETRDPVRELAAAFDSEGVPRRVVTLKLIQSRWNPIDGDLPLAKVVASLMAGGGKGGRPANAKPSV